MARPRGAKSKENCAPRLDVCLVVAVRRGEDDVVAAAAARGYQGRAVGIGNHASETARRSRRPRLSFYRSRPLRRHGQEAANYWNGPKYSAIAMARRGGRSLKALQAGCDVLFDIDWQGTQQLRERARDDLVSVFILPPTARSWSAVSIAARRIPRLSSPRACQRPRAR